MQAFFGEQSVCKRLKKMVRPTGFEPVTFGSGDPVPYPTKS